jgi:hypothetical protein
MKRDLISLRQFVGAYRATKQLLDSRIQTWPAMPAGWAGFGEHLDVLHTNVEVVARLLGECDAKMVGPGVRDETVVENAIRLMGYKDPRGIVTDLVDTCVHAKQRAERTPCPESDLYGIQAPMFERYSLISGPLEASIRQVMADEWVPASKAVQAAEREGYPITLKWLTKDAFKHGVNLRPKQLPGKHKQEVEWWSLIDCLAKRRAEYQDDETLPRRIQEAQQRKQETRPLE